MILKCLLCIFSLLILRGTSFSQENTITNLNAVDNLINESLDPFSNKLLQLGEENFYNLVTEESSEQHLYLIESIKRKFNNYKILVNEDSGSIDYLVTIKNPKIEIKYNRFFTDKILGTKKVAREVLVSYDLELINTKNSLSIFKKHFYKKIKDSFDLDKFSFVNDNRYSFSRSVLPEESSLNKFLFPAILIVTSAAAIILFFTIRSK